MSVAVERQNGKVVVYTRDRKKRNKEGGRNLREDWVTTCGVLGIYLAS